MRLLAPNRRSFFLLWMVLRVFPDVPLIEVFFHGD